MPAASPPPRGIVFVEGLLPGHYERNIRSYVSRKVWKEKRLEQVRKHQASSPSPPLTPRDPQLAVTISSAEPLEAQVELRRPRRRDSEQNAFSALLLPLELTGVAVDNARAERRHDSLLTATERELIQVDPFNTLPCRLDRPGQDLAHRAKSLFLQSSLNWSSALFAETTGFRLAYMHRANFCSMLAGASHYLDSLSGRGPSLETLQWASATTSCVRRTLSDPGTQSGDDALMGVFLLLANDHLIDGGKNSHLHSTALARLFRLRGGIESLRLPHTMELFVSFLLITPFGKAQTAYLSHISADAEGVLQLQEWEADVDLLVLELHHLNSWARHVDWGDRVERRALLTRVIGFIPIPKDTIEQDQRSFVICFLAAMMWEYRDRPEDCDALLRDFIHCFEQLGRRHNLVNIAWILVSHGDRDLKWQVIRMLKVLYHLSKSLQSKIVQFLYGLVDSLQIQDVFLDRNDFDSIRQEAFAGLPVIE